MDPRHLIRIGKAGINGYRFSKNPWKSPGFLKKLQDNAIHKTVSIAYETTDFYREKYKSHGIHPKDITKTEDLTKLPIISKEELIDNFEHAVPGPLDKKRAFLMGTSGSTGQPIQVYKDYLWLSHCFGFCIQMLRLHKMGLPKAAFILDVGSISSIETIAKGFLKFFTKRSLVLPVDQDILQIIKELEQANVEYILTYPGFMRELATLRKNGFGKKIKFKKIGLSGEILDDFTRAHIEEAFGCPCYASYVCTETGPIAIECEHKKMHIYSDMLAVEIVDNDGSLVSGGKDGNIILTCHDGGYGTPIIRYSGCSDVGQLLFEKCSCGLNTPIMGPIKGRIVDSIRLPDGRVYHAFAMTIPMEKIQREYGNGRIYRYQIVQHKLNDISISLVRNKEKTRFDESLEDIMEIIRKTYQTQLGDEIQIVVKEVEILPEQKNRVTPNPLVLSEISSRSTIYKTPADDGLKCA